MVLPPSLASTLPPSPPPSQSDSLYFTYSACASDNAVQSVGADRTASVLLAAHSGAESAPVDWSTLAPGSYKACFLGDGEASWVDTGILVELHEGEGMDYVRAACAPGLASRARTPPLNAQGWSPPVART